MKVPEGMTEEEVLAILEKIARSLSYKFVFGCYEHEDISQQAIIAGIKLLDKYDGVRPLENFLRVSMKRAMCNFKRDKYVRLNKPCLNCPIGAYIKKTDSCII